MNDNKNHFDFKDLMAVGMFILSLENITCISVTHRLSRENMKKYAAALKMDNEGLHEYVL